MDPVLKQNIIKTVEGYIDENKAIRERQDISYEQKVQLQNPVIKNLYDYLKNQGQFLAIYPRFRKTVVDKANEFLQVAGINEQAKQSLTMFLDFVANQVPHRANYVAGGGGRRRLWKKSRKGKKQSKRRSHSRKQSA